MFLLGLFVGVVAGFCWGVLVISCFVLGHAADLRMAHMMRKGREE